MLHIYVYVCVYRIIFKFFFSRNITRQNSYLRIPAKNGDCVTGFFIRNKLICYYYKYLLEYNGRCEHGINIGRKLVEGDGLNKFVIKTFIYLGTRTGGRGKKSSGMIGALNGLKSFECFFKLYMFYVNYGS